MEELVNVQPHIHVRDCLDEQQNTPPLLISNLWNPEVAQLWHFNLQKKKHPNREVSPREVLYVERDKLKQQLWKLGLIRHVFQGQSYMVRWSKLKQGCDVN